jgi:hypothetical protein
VNVTGIELAPTPLSIPSQILSVGGKPDLRLSGRESGAFRCLVTDLVENIPSINRGPLEVASALPPDPRDVDKDKGKTSTGGLEDLSGLDNANNLSKDKKRDEQTEPVVLPPPVALLQDPAVLIASTPIIDEAPKPGPVSRVESNRVTSSEYKADGGFAPPPDTASMPLGLAIPAVTALRSDVAFALRLIPVVSEPKDDSHRSSPQPVVKLAPVPSPESVQLNPNQSSAITNEVRAGLDRQAEQTPGSWAISSPAPAPQNRDDASAWPWPSLPKQSAESIAARPESGLLADQQFKSEPSMVAAPGSTDSVTRQSDFAVKGPKTTREAGTSPFQSRRSPRRNPPQNESSRHLG